MWILILTFSLTTKFHHDLDMKTVPNLSTEQDCNEIAQKVINIHKKFDKDIEVEYFCYKSGK